MLQQSQVARLFAFTGPIQTGAPDAFVSLVDPQLTDYIVQRMVVTNADSIANYVEIAIRDPGQTLLIVGGVSLDASAAPADDVVVDVTDVGGNGFARGLYVPAGWTLEARKTLNGVVMDPELFVLVGVA